MSLGRGRAGRLHAGVGGVDGDDAAEPDPDVSRATASSQRSSSTSAVEPAARHPGIDAVAEAQLAAVDVADAGDHGLVEQQRADGPGAGPGPGDEALGVGIGAQRVGAEPVAEAVEAVLVDQLARGRAGEVPGRTPGRLEPQADGVPRRVRRRTGSRRSLPKRPRCTWSSVSGRSRKREEQVLAHRLGGRSDGAVEHRGAVGEPALR